MKRIDTLRTALAVFVAASVGASWAHEQERGAAPQASQGAQHQQHGAMGAMSEGSRELHRTMMAQCPMHSGAAKDADTKTGKDMAMAMSGDVDRDFATMMTHHHEQAIRMSDVLLEHGKDEKLKALARRMQEQQRKEIQELAPHTK